MPRPPTMHAPDSPAALPPQLLRRRLLHARRAPPPHSRAVSLVHRPSIAPQLAPLASRLLAHLLSWLHSHACYTATPPPPRAPPLATPLTALLHAAPGTLPLPPRAAQPRLITLPHPPQTAQALAHISRMMLFSFLIATVSAGPTNTAGIQLPCITVTSNKWRGWRCGPNYGACELNDCCSKWHWCGTSPFHCWSKQEDYSHGGNCTPPAPPPPVPPPPPLPPQRPPLQPATEMNTCWKPLQVRQPYHSSP